MYNVEKLHKNWQSPFYSDVIVVDNASECASASSLFGTTFEPIFTYWYPGIEESCDCSAEQQDVIIFRGKCQDE